MAKLEGGEAEAHGDAWGTWAELLLAFAVNRHGTAEWDSIAAELQNRTSDRDLSLTAQNCRRKYLDLRRRHAAPNGDFDADVKSSVEETAQLLEKLRKLRVAELRRDMQRYNLNIESLELKMKWMEDERDRRESDLDKDGQERGDSPAAGGESDKDRLSVNESNAPALGFRDYPQADKSIIDEKESRLFPAVVNQVRHGRKDEQPNPLTSEADRKSVREDSCNGSSNSIDAPTKSEPVHGSADVIESDGESGDRGGDEGAIKENSDVQSSASKSRKGVGNDKVLRGVTRADAPEHEDQPVTVEGFSGEPQPLMQFIRTIRSHKLGSIFERRLLSQESSKYNKMVLQHVDLETIEARLKKGFYASAVDKYYRDLLLLVNNALVFFPGVSSEADAAVEIRRMMSNEISQRNSRSDSSTGKQGSLQSLSSPKTDDAVSVEPSETIIPEPTMPSPMMVCRKRSSIIAKSVVADKGRNRRSVLTVQKEEMPEASKPEEEPKITKKKRRERFSSVSANSKKNSKNQGPAPAPSDKNSSADSGKQQGEVGEDKDKDKKSRSRRQPALESKKRGAAVFLNRMAQGSSTTSNRLLLDALKNTPLTGDSTGSRGNKNAKPGEKKQRSTRKQVKENAASPVKRSVGRPPKRAAPPPPPSLGKRGRERGEAEIASSANQPRKRSRKL